MQYHYAVQTQAQPLHPKGFGGLACELGQLPHQAREGSPRVAIEALAMGMTHEIVATLNVASRTMGDGPSGTSWQWYFHVIHVPEHICQQAAAL